MRGTGDSRAWAGNHIWRLGGEHEEGWGCRHGWAWLGRCTGAEASATSSDQIRVPPAILWRMA